LEPGGRGLESVGCGAAGRGADPWRECAGGGAQQRSRGGQTERAIEAHLSMLDALHLAHVPLNHQRVPPPVPPGPSYPPYSTPTHLTLMPRTQPMRPCNANQCVCVLEPPCPLSPHVLHSTPTHLTMRPCTQPITSYTSGTTSLRPRIARSSANAGPRSPESSALRSANSQDSRKRSCVCVCVCVCVTTCVCMCACAYVWVYGCVWVWVGVCGWKGP